MSLYAVQKFLFAMNREPEGQRRYREGGSALPRSVATVEADTSRYTMTPRRKPLHGKGSGRYRRTVPR